MKDAAEPHHLKKGRDVVEELERHRCGRYRATRSMFRFLGYR